MSDPITNEPNEKPEVDLEDRRAVIEAAFEADEAARAAPEPAAKPEPEAAKPEGVKPEPVAKPDTPEPNEPDGEQEVRGVERAPQSWKPATRAQWDKLPLEVRQEVVRREQQTTKVLSESANARRLAQEVEQVAQPFMARLQSLGATPVVAMAELLKADHILSTAPKAQKAQYMAKLIADYGVDIEDLDNALAGNVQRQQDPQVQVQAEVERLLQQRLQPYQSLLQREQQREQEEAQTLHQTVEQMSRDPKFPYFQDLRSSMADIIDVFAKNGKQISLEEAYNKAALLDSEISGLVAADAKRRQATEANAKAQRARAASVSVGGAPSGLMSGAPAAGDRRAVIEAAFDAASNR